METMTSKERWLAVLAGERPDRMPTDIWATQEAIVKLLGYLKLSSPEDAYRQLHIDNPVSVEPRYVGPPLPKGQDVYGCRFKRIEYEGGVYDECVSHPLADCNSVAEIEATYTWPTADWYDYSSLPDMVERSPEHPIMGGGSEPFLTYKELRGYQQAYMDLALNPDIVHYCLDRLFEFCYEKTSRIYEQVPGKIDLTFVSEDLGSQEGLLISREHVLEFLLPHMRRMMELAHQAGAYVFHHSDGAVSEVIPDMIEAGIDILNPIQWRCKGMDREMLKARFGDRLVFHGAMDNQETLVFGDVEDVRREVAENIRILGEGGGYILAPCHNIQAVSPPENIVAMYEEAYRLGSSG